MMHGIFLFWETFVTFRTCFPHELKKLTLFLNSEEVLDIDIRKILFLAFFSSCFSSPSLCFYFTKEKQIK